jgi:hypothetical protein
VFAAPTSPRQLVPGSLARHPAPDTRKMQALIVMTVKGNCNARPPGTNGMVHFMSEHRFRLTLLVCALALMLMLSVAYGTVYPGSIWVRFAVGPV